MAMRFKVKDIDNHAEKLICIGMIASDYVLSQIAAILDPNIFTARYTQYIAKWCLEHYKNHEAAPKAHIQDIFEFHKRDELDDAVADLVETLLVNLSDQLAEDSELNEDYILEQAVTYIKSRKATMLCEDTLALLSKGQITEAEAALANYTMPQRPAADGDDIFTTDFWNEQEEERKTLFLLPGALGNLVGPIERDSFISLLAPEKRGKTWFLMWIALTAYRQRRNVAFFSCGDMTKQQMRRRFRHMLTHVDPKRTRKSVVRAIPDCHWNQIGQCPLGEDTDQIRSKKDSVNMLKLFEEFPDHVVCTKCFKHKRDSKYFIGRPWWEEVEVTEVAKNIEEARDRLVKRSGKKQLKLFCYPPTTINVAGIKAQLAILEQQENFVPDILIIDYADILDSEEKARRLEYRHQINTTWMALRALSQEKNCAVITATQAKDDAKKRSSVEQWDASEDKRKLGHVTGMLALNQTPEEKRYGVMRISNLASRDDEFDVDRCVVALQCLSLGQPVNYLYEYKHTPEPAKKEGNGNGRKS